MIIATLYGRTFIASQWQITRAEPSKALLFMTVKNIAESVDRDRRNKHFTGRQVPVPMKSMIRAKICSGFSSALECTEQLTRKHGRVVAVRYVSITGVYWLVGTDC